MKEKKKKEKFVDDGRTIYNMDVEGFRWHEKNKAKQNLVTKDEKRTIVRSAYKAYLPALLIVVGAFVLASVLIYLWLK